MPLLSCVPALILIDRLHAGDDLAEHGILAVEEAGVGEADEELGIGRIRVARTRHAHRAAGEVRVREFVGNVGQVGAAGAGAGRIAGLRHEARNDAVEHDAVIELALHQLLDLRDVLGREVGAQADYGIAVLGGQRERIGGGVVGVSGEGGEQGKREQRSTAEGMHSGLLGKRSLRVGGEADRFDLVGMIDFAVVRFRARLDLVDDVHARDPLRRNRIFPVQERSIAKADEELRICRIRIAPTRHAHRAALERFLGELGRNVRQVRSAHASASRIAGLGHEAGNDTMKDDAVVELALHQLLDLRDVLGRQIGPEANDDVAVFGLEHDRVGDIFVRRCGEGDEQGKREQRATAERMHLGLVGGGSAAGAA